MANPISKNEFKFKALCDLWDIQSKTGEYHKWFQEFVSVTQPTVTCHVMIRIYDLEMVLQKDGYYVSTPIMRPASHNKDEVLNHFIRSLKLSLCKLRDLVKNNPTTKQQTKRSIDYVQYGLDSKENDGPFLP